jgi:hypothetical protein
MTATSEESARLSDEDLVRLMPLIKGSDSVELKLTVSEAQERTIISAMGADPLDAQVRQVFFFDTPDLRLDEAGVVVRARRVQGKGDDTVVKLRPVVPDKLPRALRRTKDFSVEVDATPGGYVCSGSLKRQLDEPLVKATVEGERPLRKLFSKDQRELFADHAPEGVELDELAVLGPIFVLKLKTVPRALGREQVIEMWFYPDDSRIVELSTKCAPTETFDVAAEGRAFLVERGIDITGDQETKTRKALDFFSRQLAGAA